MLVEIISWRPSKDETRSALGRGDVKVGDTIILRNVGLFKNKDDEFFISPPKTQVGSNWYDSGFSFVYADGKIAGKSKELYDSILEAVLEASQKKGGIKNAKSQKGGF